MSINPFDDANACFVVLVNNEGRHSLRPAFADLPAGCQVAYGEPEHAAFLDYIGQIWTDIRPRSLRERPAAGGFLKKPPGLGVGWSWMTVRFR